MADLRSDDARAATGFLAFWAEAGVDTAVEDTPVDRLTPPPRKPLRAADPAAAGAPDRSPGVRDLPALVARAWRTAAAAADLAALEAAIAAYEGCTLKAQGARQAVFARGRSDAPVMIIGEGPGAEEDLQGAPFVGRAGKLLDRMLAAAELSEQVFITNTVFWRPPGNRNPTPEEQMACQPFLERAIALVRPKLLLLVGGVSAKALLKREEGVLKLRGRWFEWESADGSTKIPALPTLHPAFLLRQPVAKKQAWADLLTLKSRLDRVL